MTPGGCAQKIVRKKLRDSVEELSLPLGVTLTLAARLEGGVFSKQSDILSQQAPCQPMAGVPSRSLSG